MKIIILFCALFSVSSGISLKSIDHNTVPEFIRAKSSSNARSVFNVNKTPMAEMDPQFWRTLADRELVDRLTAPNNKKAKNIIFFLGDGMSLTTVTAARIRKGQLKGNTGEEEVLSFEKFPHAGLSKTYCADAQVPDSACTATAYHCGVKTNFFTIGVTPNVRYNNCSMSMDPENHLTTIADWAQSAGKSTGFITTTTLTHASPSGMYAKTAHRFWECDADIAEEVRQQGPCMDMAQQLIKRAPGRNFDVLMGGGMGKLLPNTQTDAHGNPGERLDGRNLLSLWQDMHPTGAIVTNRDELLNLNVSSINKIMGVFNSKVMDFHADADPQKKPTLEEMTEVALNLLSRNDKGYYIFIEGGLIDYGNHFNRPYISLDEALEMEKAIQRADDMTNSDDTLIVVSSDHGHTLTIAGYASRGTNILGVNQDMTDSNGIKYYTLNYAVGPEQYLDKNGKRSYLEGSNTDEKTFIHPSQVPASMGTHSGDDVGIFARGPQSHLFGCVLQQHTIPHLMAYASCIGDGPTMCDSEK